MTVSPPGHEHYFEELVKLVASGGSRPDANAIAALRSRYDTEQLSALKRTQQLRLAGQRRFTSGLQVLEVRLLFPSAIGVAGLMHPDMIIEVEATAVWD